MADLMPQKRLPAEAGEVQHARCKGDLRTAGDGACAGFFYRLALIEPDRGQIRAERVLHLLTHGVGQIDPAPPLLRRRDGGTGTQRVQMRRVRNRLRILRLVSRRFSVGIRVIHILLLKRTSLSVILGGYDNLRPRIVGAYVFHMLDAPGVSRCNL